MCLPPEYDRTRLAPFEREGCNFADVRRMMSKIYADSLARSNSCSLRGIARRDIAMQATGLDLSNTNYPYCNTFSHYTNDCANFKAVRQQDQRRRKRQHNQLDRHQPHHPKPRGAAAAEGRGKHGANTTRPLPTATPIAPPGWQTSPAATPTLPKSVLRLFLGSVVRGVFLCVMTPTRSPASHSWQERFSLQPSTLKPKWTRKMGPGYSVQPRQQ